jgi:hypothetical protein
MKRSLAFSGMFDLDQAIQDARDLHDGKNGLPASHALPFLVQEDGKVQTAVAQRREWMSLVHGKRREDRPHISSEANFQSASLFLAEVARAHKNDASLAGQLWRNLAPPILIERLHHVVRALANPGQLLGWQHAIGIHVVNPTRHQLFEPCNADHKEFVEIARDDGLELQPLGELDRGVARLFQNPCVEFQPRELTVEKGARLVVAVLINRFRLFFIRGAGSQVPNFGPL